MKTTTGNVKIGNRFFLTERNNYSDFRLAIWRELAQNSLDAGTPKIDITLSQDEDGNSRIVFRDEGKGMSKDILLNTFMVVGNTAAKEGNSAGGFGKAKVLLAFANPSYKITSFNYVCEGSGADFTIEEGKEFVRGCSFEIVVESSAESMKEKLLEFMDLSYLPYTRVYLNGESINKSLHRGRKVRDLSFGEVWVNKSGKKNLLIVRVNGIAMFSSYIAVPAQVILNIAPEKSRDILLSNRDSLKYSYQQEFNLFMQELAVDCVTALDDKSKRFTKYVNKAKFLSKRKKTEATIAPADTGEKNFWEEKPAEITHAEKPVMRRDFGQCENAHYTEQQLCPILASMVIVNECNDQKIVNLIKFYDPTKGTIGSNRYSFIKQWYAVIDKALEKYLEMTGQENINFAIGLVFDTSEQTTLAQHIYSDGTHYFLINPILRDGKMRYSINKRGDAYRLLSKATHEISHASYSGHSQDFAYFRDALFEECLQDMSEFFQAIKDAK